MKKGAHYPISGSLFAAILSSGLVGFLLWQMIYNPAVQSPFAWGMKTLMKAGPVGCCCAVGLLIMGILIVMLPPISIFSRQTREWMFSH